MDTNISNIRIFDKDINFLGEVDDFTSLFFIRKWDTYGEFEFHLSKLDRALIKKGNIIMVNNDGNKAGIIEYIEIDEENGEDIKVKGYSLLYMLTFRLTVPPENCQTHSFSNLEVGEIINTLVKVNSINTLNERVIDNLTIENIDLNIAKESKNIIKAFETRYANLCDELTKLCKTNGLGITIDLDYIEKKFVFKVIEGRDLSVTQKDNSPAIFSVEYDNVKKQNYIESNVGYKNCAYVAPNKSAEEKDIAIIHDEIKGIDRREIVIDASNSAFKDQLSILGEQKLEEKKEIQSYECEVDSVGYKDIWDLGDIVTTVSKKYDFKFDNRVSEVKEIYESKTIKIEPTFGSVQLTVLDIINNEDTKDLKVSN